MVLWPADLIEALIATDRREDAGAALTALAAQARRTGGAWAQGVVARYRGVLADDADIDAAVRARDRCHDDGCRSSSRARACVTASACAAPGGGSTRARSCRQALAGFEALGARAWAERARRELAGTRPARARAARSATATG